MDKLYKREEYLKKIRPFYNDDLIKVITGIRRCGKSSLLKCIVSELLEQGIAKEDIIFIELDKKSFSHIKTDNDLDKEIEKNITNRNYKYLFIDEIQNIENFENIINFYREEGNISIFITGSNSYLLSGELATKLTGRYIEIELKTLSFYEYIEMKKFLGKNVDFNYYKEFEEYIRNGGFPKSLYYENLDEKVLYIRSVIEQIFEKDIKKRSIIRNKEVFDLIQKYIINNFGSIISSISIQKNIKGQTNLTIDRRTIKKYLELLEKAKIIIPCELFDIKSKNVLKGEKKYYLADLSIYYALNTDNRINYGPVLENVLHHYLLSKNYKLSVGKIGSLEVDFIVRKNADDYYYVQISKNIDDEKTQNREYKPFYEIKDMYPRYLFVLDLIFKEKTNGINNVNIVDFILNNADLH